MWTGEVCFDLKRFSLGQIMDMPIPSPSNESPPNLGFEKQPLDQIFYWFEYYEIEYDIRKYLQLIGTIKSWSTQNEWVLLALDFVLEEEMGSYLRRNVPREIFG